MVMGLDLDSADDTTQIFQGAYSAFYRFRRYVERDMRAAKIKTGGSGAIYFFHHSDCDGFWSSSECSRILKFLKKVYPNVEPMGSDESPEWDIIKADPTTQAAHMIRLRLFLQGIIYCVTNQQCAVFH